MMTKLLDALRQKFRTPAEAVEALGLDAALFDAPADETPPVIAHDDALAPPWADRRFTPAMAVDSGVPILPNAGLPTGSIGPFGPTTYNPSPPVMQPGSSTPLKPLGTGPGGSNEEASDNTTIIRSRRFTPIMARTVVKDAFEEGKHPRDHGKFSSGGGGLSSGSSKGSGMTHAQQAHHKTLTGAGYEHHGMVSNKAENADNVAYYKHPSGHFAMVSPSGRYEHHTPVTKTSSFVNPINGKTQPSVSHEWRTERGGKVGMERTLSRAHASARGA